MIVRTIVNRGKKDGRPNSSLSREHSVALGGHVGRPCLWRGFQLIWRARGGEGRGRGYWPLEISCMKWDSVVVLCVCVFTFVASDIFGIYLSL